MPEGLPEPDEAQWAHWLAQHQQRVVGMLLDDLLQLVRREAGPAPAEQALRQAGLRRADLAPGAAPLGFDVFYRLLDGLYRRRVIAVPGLQLGARRRLGDYGVLGHSVSSGHSFGEALRLALGFPATSWGYARIEALRDGPWAGVRLVPQPSAVCHPVPLAQAMVAAAVAFCRELLPDHDFSACEIRFGFARPPDAAHYAERLPAPVRFGAAHTELCIPAAWLETPLRPLLDSAAQRGALQAWQRAQAHRSWCERTEELLLYHCAGGFMALPQAAAALGVAPRTLRQHLRDEGVSFRALLARVRLGLAERYLRETELPVLQIAELLGYAHRSSFERAYRSHFGKAPRQR